jgi:hypothetical protein
MNVFAADDLEVADLLALARLDDDGAPPAVIPPQAQAALAVQLTPARTGGG